MDNNNAVGGGADQQEQEEDVDWEVVDERRRALEASLKLLQEHHDNLLRNLPKISADDLAHFVLTTRTDDPQVFVDTLRPFLSTPTPASLRPRGLNNSGAFPIPLPHAAVERKSLHTLPMHHQQQQQQQGSNSAPFSPLVILKSSSTDGSYVDSPTSTTTTTSPFAGGASDLRPPVRAVIPPANRDTSSSSVQPAQSLQISGSPPSPSNIAMRMSMEVPPVVRGSTTRRFPGVSLPNQNLDIAFLVDCTASMQTLLLVLEHKLRDLLQNIQNKYDRLNIRVAFVGYRDFDAPQRYTVFDFMSIEQMMPLLRNIDTRAGPDADTAEDVLGGYYQATRLRWESKFKILLHFADAPGHGSRFHDFTYPRSDNYYYKPPVEHASDLAEIYLNELMERRVQVTFFQMGRPEWTNKMRLVFQNIFDKRGQSKRFNSVLLNLNSDMMDSGALSTEFLDKVLNSASMSLMSMGARTARQGGGSAASSGPGHR